MLKMISKSSLNSHYKTRFTKNKAIISAWLDAKVNSKCVILSVLLFSSFNLCVFWKDILFLKIEVVFIDELKHGLIENVLTFWR